MDLGNQLGWSYLLDYQNLKINSDSKTITHLIFPVTNTTITSKKFGTIGVWFDQRNLVDQTHYLDKNNGPLFYYPYNWLVINQLENKLFPQESDIKVLVLSPDLPTSNNFNSSIFYISFDQKIQSKYFIDKTIKINPESRWKQAKLSHPLFKSLSTYFLTTSNKKNIVYIFPENYSDQNIHDFLDIIESV